MADSHTIIDLGDGRPLMAHPLRAPVINELHARPAFPLEAPRRIVHLAFSADEPAPLLAQVFDPASLCASELEEGAALAATDFRTDAAGFTRILAESRMLAPGRAGALV